MLSLLMDDNEKNFEIISENFKETLIILLLIINEESNAINNLKMMAMKIIGFN
jgi:hypothetical protein